MEIPVQSEHFTPMQHHLLKMFAKGISDEHLNEIKQLLVRYFADKLSEEMEKHIAQQGKTVDEWVDELKHAHLRTPYKRG